MTKEIQQPLIRCPWPGNDTLYIQYHDKEWGKPLHNDNKLFEFLLLEGAQAGLSWITVLKKRENYRQAFDNFDPEKIARYRKARVEKLLTNPGIIRNRLKVNAMVTNAQAFLNILDQYSSFDEFIWQFVDGRPVQNNWKTMRSVPATSKISEAMSKELKQRGFKFVGSTICYAYMQATGMVNDHLVKCFRHHELCHHD